MTCDQCPFVIPCWAGTLYRSVCPQCGAGVMHPSLALRYLIVKCPVPSPVPAIMEQACLDCSDDKWKGYRATNVCPGLDYYNMEMDETYFAETPQLTPERFREMFDEIAKQRFTPIRHVLYWDDKPKKTKT